MAAPKNLASKSPGVFDVARPSHGQITSSGTSKPDMITHRPVMKDPMVTTVDDAVEPTAPLLKSAKKLVIKPLHDDVRPEEPIADVIPVSVKSTQPAPIVEAETTDEAQFIPVARVTTGSPTKAPQVSDNQVSLSNASGQPVTVLEPILAPGVPPIKRNDTPQSSEQTDKDVKTGQQRATHLQEIIDEEAYFLPINAVEARRSRRIAVLGLLLIIMLAAAWYDVALDAGLITNTYNLPHSSLFTIK